MSRYAVNPRTQVLLLCAVIVMQLAILGLLVTLLVQQ